MWPAGHVDPIQKKDVRGDQNRQARGWPGMSGPAASPPSIDPVAVIRSRPYIAALLLAAVLDVPISIMAHGFLALVAALQRFVFVGLPNQVLGVPAPAWWPVPWLVLCGLLTASTIRYLPLPLVAFRLVADSGYDEFDIAWQLSAERGWMVPAYTCRRTPKT